MIRRRIIEKCIRERNLREPRNLHDLGQLKMGQEKKVGGDKTKTTGGICTLEDIDNSKVIQ
jgi:hypothetical protein